MSEFKDEAERDQYVLRLRFRLHWTERQIAQALELSQGKVHRIIEKHEKSKESVE